MNYFQIKKAVFFLLLNFILYNTYSQNLHLIPDVKSPNVSSFETYGNIPVNLFTGTPNISVPIYTLQSGSIKVPINLSYHPSNVKPAVQPGWVGFGWSLNPGGAITRKKNGGVDEWFNKYEIANGLLALPYYPYEDKVEYENYEYGSELINNYNDWDSEEKMKGYLTASIGDPFVDVTADEFFFNFLGYSGKFIYSGPNKGWQIVSDQNLKVEISGFLGYNDIYNDIMGEYDLANLSGNVYELKQTRFFKGFKITTPDGTIYEFGGFNGVELSSEYANKYSTYSINTWLLTKITDINNRVVEFSYKRTYPTCNLNFSAQTLKASINNGQDDLTSLFDWIFSNQVNRSTDKFFMNNAYVTELYGSYQWPLYLEKISSSAVDVLFSSDVANCLVYTRPVDNVITSQLRTPRSGLYADDFDHVKGDVSNIQWEQLNSISVKDKSKLGDQTNVIHEFIYSNHSNKRLALETYEKLDANDNSRNRYEFDYNEMNAYDGITCDGNYSDHWGYFNNVNADGAFVSEVGAIRSVKPEYLMKGLLDKIFYPMGGYTEFKWEPNDYSKVVSTNRLNINTVTGNPKVGGVRIKKISGYSDQSELLSEKKYFYKKKFIKGANLSSLSSSGTLNVEPQYVFSFSERPNILGEGTAYYEHGTFNSITDYGNIGQGSHIGYDEVTEENMDGSYTKHYYTSYGKDINGESHYDKQAIEYVGFLPRLDKYMPFSFLEVERGKEVGVFKFNNNNTPVEKRIIEYRRDDNRFDSNNYIRRIPWHLIFSLESVSMGLIAATHDYSYSYYPIKAETTTYDVDGNNPIVSSVNYKYNAANQVIEQTVVSSSNTVLKTKYKYPIDFSSSPYPQMVNVNYISPIVETIKLEDNTQVNLTRTKHISVNNLFLPRSLETQKGSSDPVITNTEVLRSDDVNGNILEYSIQGGITNVLIWGYHNQYLIAKIENATYSEVASKLGVSVDELRTYNEHNLDSLNSLRNTLTKAMITTYTYDALLGIRSITDSRGKSSYYYYDDFGRLSYVRDNNGEILSYNKYHYKN